jgi:hypothetical protein
LNPLNHTNQLNIHPKFPHLNTIFEGGKREGIYLLEYHDSYLKDAFVSQLAEYYIDQGLSTLFVQKESDLYSFRDLFLCRTLFKQNPHRFPSLSKIKHEEKRLIPRMFGEPNDYDQGISIISPNSKYLNDFLNLVRQSLNNGPKNQFIIIDSHTDFFFSSNLIPQLVRIASNHKATILFTSQITSEKFIDKSLLLPAFLQSSLYLHSKHPNLYSLSDSKGIAYEFELEVRNNANERLKNYFTIRPACAYCQES